MLLSRHLPPPTFSSKFASNAHRRQYHLKIITLCLLFSLVSIFAVYLSLNRLHLAAPLSRPALQQSHQILPAANTTKPQPLTLVTLTYNQHREHPLIEHNCVFISSTIHRYVIYTDNMTRPYCNLCECRLYKKRECPCPRKDCGRKNPCEKLLFFIDTLNDLKEMVFIDSDLLILHPQFLIFLQARAAVHDFLATYGHWTMASWNYYRDINSGLVFIRRLPHLNYSEMVDRLYKRHAWKDQVILGKFVQEKYKNWDTLSWRWHCRALKTMKQDIPYTECYTIHDRLDYRNALKAWNKTLLTIK